MKKEMILVVEDDRSILTGLQDLLEGEGYAVATAEDGEEALRVYEREKPSLILLDIMIPEKSGYDVCREIRKKDEITPILMLTAKGQEVEKVVGLEMGADDYIVKPFGVNELLARVRAGLRRSRQKPAVRDGGPIAFEDVTIDPKTYSGKKGNRTFAVSARELALLRFFLDHDGEVIERFRLLDEIWGIRYEGTTRTLDQHIAKLRQKIEDDPANPRFIQTVHGIGYRFQSKN
ncbi:MAG: winged-helix transcriptional response regulator [Candidatus Aminicenantes bacterium]|nr:winged-helix transcriptional response regulator [Candidatus Aminicenantes bacterium]